MGETAHIIVAAELTNMAADSGELPAMLDAVRANLDADASQVLADAGYRGEAVFEQLKDHPTADFVQQIGSPPWMPDQVRHDKTFSRADSQVVVARAAATAA